MAVAAAAPGQCGVAAPAGRGVDEDGAGAALHLGRGRHHQRRAVLVDVARGGQDGLLLPLLSTVPARRLQRLRVAGHLVDVGRTGAAGERRAGRAVRRAEGDLGEALAVLLVEPDQPVQLVLDVVDLGERERGILHDITKDITKDITGLQLVGE